MPPEEFDLAPLIAGEKRAWDRFVSRFSPIIFAAVRRKLVSAGRLEEAEDVAQNVFLRLCNKNFHLIKSYDPRRAKLSTWLTVVATSTTIDHLRRKTLKVDTLDATPESALAVEPVEKEHLKIPPGLLPPRQALIVQMLYQQDMDVRETAEFLGIEPQTVRSLHHKAITKLRSHFQKELDLP